MTRHERLLETVRRRLTELETRIDGLAGRLAPRRLADLRAELDVVREQYRAALAAGVDLPDERALALGHALERLARRVTAAA